MKNLLFILFLVTTVFCYGQKQETTKLFLIRHTEKMVDGTNDPELSQEGFARAKQWASVLQSEAVDAVYSTNYKRTQTTARVIAEAEGIDEVQSYLPGKMDVEKLTSELRGKTAVIVGHSNTIPFLVNKIIGEQRFQQIEESNYSNLYIITCSSKEVIDVCLLHIN